MVLKRKTQRKKTFCLLFFFFSSFSCEGSFMVFSQFLSFLVLQLNVETELESCISAFHQEPDGAHVCHLSISNTCCWWEEINLLDNIVQLNSALEGKARTSLGRSLLFIQHHRCTWSYAPNQQHWPNVCLASKGC